MKVQFIAEDGTIVHSTLYKLEDNERNFTNPRKSLKPQHRANKTADHRRTDGITHTKAHEEAIFLEMEWLSPYGLDRCQEHLDDLRKDIKKDTEKVPEAQDDCIRKGDKVRVTKGADYGHSFIVQGIFAETNGLQIIGEDYTLWDVDYLVKC